MLDQTCNCGNTIPGERIELGFTNCVGCAEKYGAPRKKGVMIYGHKTAGAVQIMDGDVYSRHKHYYKPQGRSALKAVSKNICA